MTADAPGWRVAAGGLVLSACVAAWAATGDQTRHVPRHLALYAVAFVAYLVALKDAPALRGRALHLALGVSLAWRLALLAAPPLLSDDVYRYVWEGRIQRHGGNPYAWSDRPEAERFGALRDEVWRGVAHKGYTAIYPPLWQLAARAVVTLHDSVTAMKAFAVACEVAAALLLLRLLKARGRPPGHLLVLAWSPLALVEIAGGGHNDAAGLLAVAAALLALERGSSAGAALALAAGAATKLFPAVLGLAWWRRLRPVSAIAASAAAAATVVPYLSAGPGLWMSLGKYAALWRFNDSGFALLAGVLPHREATLVAFALVAALAAALAACRADPVASGLLVTVAWLAMAPSVFPWYALWLLPFLVVRETPSALLFTGTVQLAYLVYPEFHSTGNWALGWGARAVEYGPCLALAALHHRGRTS